MESTLSLRKSDYESKVGQFLGWGPGPDNGGREWTAKEQLKIKDIVESGLCRFYKPTPFYAWSFLKRQPATLTLAADATTVALPDDFSGLEGDITVRSDDSGFLPSIDVVNPVRVDKLHSESSTATGRPQVASVRSKKAVSAVQGQRQELYVYPTADAEYTLSICYSILASYLDGTHPFAYGGAEHRETILESCLAVAEERLNNQQGVHALAFQRELQSSIQADQRKKEQTFGLNTDSSDDKCSSGYLENYAPATINGVEYD